MPTISQKLGFDASSAVKNLGSLTSKLAQSTQALKTFQAQAGKGTGNLESNLKKGKKAAEGLVVTWKTLARVIGTQFVVRGLASFLGLLKGGIADAHSLGIAIEEVQTIAGRETGSAQLTQDIISLSDAIGKSSQDLAEAFYQTLSNQVVETGEALEFTAQAAKLATITVSETKDAVNALSSVMNSYGFEAERAEHVANTLFKTVELGRLRLSEIANVIGRVTPLTAAMGVSWEETAASLAVMTRQGVKADTAITQLRAVMTKIIRPTEEMRDIFHTWGVRDGKEAVETFGGLNGVLQKLAEETGHSSEAMADLLRRVRTIVGQLSLMGDGGEALAETLIKIQESSGELTKQWDEFTASDAHRLTVEMNEFKNTLTELGLVTVPQLSRALGFVNDWMTGLEFAGRSIRGEFDLAGQQAEVMKRIAIRVGDEIREDARRFDEEQRKRYDGLTGAANKYYVGIQQEENKLAAIRDIAIEAATNSVKKQGTSVVAFYKNASKTLANFVAGINGTIKDNAQSIADLENKITDSKLQAELALYKTNRQKIGVIDKALAAQRQKAAVAFGDIDVTEESRDRALAENQIVLDLAKQKLSLAESQGHVRTIRDAEEERQGILRNSVNIYKEHDKQLSQNKDKLAAISEEMKAGEKELQALYAQRDKILDSGDLDATNAKRRAASEAALESVHKRIDAIATGAGRHAAFLKSLGIDTGFDALSGAVTEALNQSHKDWKAEVQRFKTEFESTVMTLQVAIDPTGAKAAAADVLGLEPFEGEGKAGFARRTDEASLALLKERDSIDQALLAKQKEINGLLATSSKYIVAAVRGRDKELAGAQRIANTQDAVADAIGFATGGLVEMEKTSGAVADNIAQVKASTGTFAAELLKVKAQLQQGNALTKTELEAFRERLNLARKNGEVNAAQAEAFLVALDSQEKANVKAREYQAIYEKRPEENAIEAAEAIAAGLTEARDAGLEVAEAGRSTERTIEAVRELTGQYDVDVQQVTESQKQQTVAAEATVNAVADIGTASADNVMVINGVAQAFANVAVEARKAAAAAASVGGPAAQFHGGQMARFFADGGQVGRGQDKILTALSKGETVVNSRNSSRFASELNAMNQGSKPVFREQGGPVTNVGDVNVTVNGGDTSQRTVRAIAHELRRDFQRGNIKFR